MSGKQTVAVLTGLLLAGALVALPPYAAPSEVGDGGRVVDAEPAGVVHRWIGSARPTGELVVEERVVFLPEPLDGWLPRNGQPVPPPEPVYETRLKTVKDVPYDLAAGRLVLTLGVVVGLTIAALVWLRRQASGGLSTS